MRDLWNSIELRFDRDALLAKEARAIYWSLGDQYKSPPFVNVEFEKEPLHTFDTDIYRYLIRFEVVTQDIRGADAFRIVDHLSRVFGESRITGGSFKPVYLTHVRTTGPDLSGDRAYDASIAFEGFVQPLVNRPAVRAV